MNQLRLSLSTLTLAALCSLFAASAHAAPLNNTFGGPAGYGPNMLTRCDDCSSAAINLTGAFPGGLSFFGGTYQTFFVNNNGNITFNGPLAQFTPQAFPVAMQPMIAPYWGDVMTISDTATNTNCVAGNGWQNCVSWGLAPGRVAVTWHNVAYYDRPGSTKRMDFQMILTAPAGCGAGDFDVEFRYNRCEWEVGYINDINHDGLCAATDTACIAAQGGFDAGNSMDFVEMPGSRRRGVNFCTTSNIGMPGIWRFSIRHGAVSCPGTGASCESGGMGACSLGITQCVGRDIVCTQLLPQTLEQCDGIDNDCNGMIDDGADLCASPSMCVNGRCVPPCFEGGCNPGEACNSDGICVEPACMDVTCGPAQRCSAGQCVGLCDGVMCPRAEQCISGRCVDLCDVLDCGDHSVCVDGACIPSCPCHACPAGDTCQPDGTCLSAACAAVTCPFGQYCLAGVCHDSCEGVTCPSDQHCDIGRCIDGAPPQPDAGIPMEDAGTEVDSGAPDAGITVDAGIPDFNAGGPPPIGDTGGCKCSMRPTGTLPSWAVIAVLGGLFARRRRRARRASQSRSF